MKNSLILSGSCRISLSSGNLQVAVPQIGYRSIYGVVVLQFMNPDDWSIPEGSDEAVDPAGSFVPVAVTSVGVDIPEGMVDKIFKGGMAGSNVAEFPLQKNDKDPFHLRLFRILHRK